MANQNPTHRSRPNVPNRNQPRQTSNPGGNQNQWRARYEHYSNLARQAADRVTSEQHWQHAEHFIRLINGTA